MRHTELALRRPVTTVVVFVALALIYTVLIGAFIISVIQNGMNLLGMESYTQQVVLGAVILAAVLLDKFRSSGGLIRRWKRRNRRPVSNKES